MHNPSWTLSAGPTAWAWPDLGLRTRQWWTRLNQATQAREARHQLAGLNDDALADLGVTRCTSRISAAQPAWDIASRAW